MTDKTDLRHRLSEFWRRNQIIALHLPMLIVFLFGSYVVLKAVDSRIGVEGFGDLFGYGLNGVRAALIIFTAWWMKRKLFFDLHAATELRLFAAREKGDKAAFWMTVLDRAEWVVLLAFATWWYTR